MSILREEWLSSKDKGISLPEDTALVLQKIESALSETIALDEENSLLFVKRMQEESTEKKEINIPGQNAARAMKAYGKKGKL